MARQGICTFNPLMLLDVVLLVTLTACAYCYHLVIIIITVYEHIIYVTYIMLYS